MRSRRLLVLLTLLLGLGALPPATGQASSAPVLSAAGETLNWTVAGTDNTYAVLARGPGGQSITTVTGETYTPPAVPGATVRYRVKATEHESAWSNPVSISYPGAEGEPPPEETEPPKPGEPPPPPSGAKVSAAPSGPATPSGGWQVAFADAFGAPLGSGAGQDDFWYTNRFNPTTGDQKGGNANELQVFNPSQVRIGPLGLELIAEHIGPKQYRSGEIMTANTQTNPKFRWQAGKGQTICFEFVVKMPPAEGNADPGMWSADFHWESELDMPELFGWNTHPGQKYVGGVNWFAGSAGRSDEYDHDFGAENDLVGQFNRYTTCLYPTNTFSMWMNGANSEWIGIKGVSAPANPNFPAEGMGLIIQYALREYEGTFTSGTRTMYVRSAAVYIDKPHEGVGITAGGIAPGTTLGG
jgi:hypothetical protein